MLDLFNLPNNFIGGRDNVTLTRYYKQQTASIQKIVRYEHGHGAAIDSSHVLLKLLYSLPTVLSDDIIDFYNATVETELKLANSIGVTNSRGEGIIEMNSFFPGENILILDRTKLKFSDLLKMQGDMWKSLSPLQCLKICDSTNPLSVAKNVPKNTGTDFDYSVLSINFSTFSLMAKMWSDQNNKKEYVDRESPNQFISRYVIPNMLSSQCNAAITRDLFRTMIGEDIARDKLISSQWVLDYTDHIVYELSDMVSELPLTSIEMEEGLDILPSISGGSILSSIPVLDDQQTQLNLWAYYPAVIDILNLGFQLIKRSDTGLSDFRHRFRFHSRQYTGNSLLRKVSKVKLRRTLENELDDMISALK